MLITQQKAQLPPPHGAPAQRGVTRGPKIEFVGQDGQRSPLHLHLKFRSFGGAKINLDAFRAAYLRTPDVDLTERLKPFLSEDGVDVPAAEIPSGEHAVRVEIKDSDGRTTSTSFVLKIEP